ncbi:DUF1902 domain-containing protein [Rhodoferax sp.]|uniref:DUF1902 domain-containing protein n=1 Tax=Rhodoferax sp. TaxID=50421 RepID=UPI002607F599|nr:DUF1902 domain-containing protein [Rhodoferax sp.]MDD2811064.1 DUF1902 domain-containing protein [Rhodoferax sp.]MDD4942578.1 DUF1902 domain-containing protein [Rhodoferax sp.]
MKTASLITYRVGFPGWKLAARLGVPLQVRVQVHYDPEVKSYWTTSPDLAGLVVCAPTLDALLREASIGIDELLELSLNTSAVHATPRMSFTPEALSFA